LSLFLEHAADAVFDFGTLEGRLTNTDIVNGFDALAPSVDLASVDITSGGSVLEEQCQ
jgi:hypothetical protein